MEFFSKIDPLLNLKIIDPHLKKANRKLSCYVQEYILLSKIITIRIRLGKI